MEVSGYEELYWVDIVGNVFSKKRNIFLKPSKLPNGYLHVILYKNGKKKTYYVHRLVAIAYLNNPNNLSQVNHINCIRDDNRVENLEWCTNLYNTQPKNTSNSIGYIRKYSNKYHFIIQINKKRIRYYCPSQNIAEAMRQVFVDLL